jgi:hypothetical protein
MNMSFWSVLIFFIFVIFDYPKCQLIFFYFFFLKNSVNRDDIKLKTIFHLIIDKCKEFHYFFQKENKLMAAPLAKYNMGFFILNIKQFNFLQW